MAPLTRRAIQDRQAALIWWTIGVAVYCVFIMAVWPVIDGNQEFEDLYTEMPDALQAMFGSDGFAGFTSPPGFLNGYLYSMILPLIFTGLAVSLGSSLIAGEEESGLLDLLLSYPVSRTRAVVEKILAVALAVAGLGAATVMILAVMREFVGLDIGIRGLAVATLGSVLFALMHGLVALGVGAWSGAKGVATGVGWGVALGGYLLNLVANLADSLDALAPFSPLHWATAGSPLTGGIPGTYVALVAVGGILAIATVVVFERHDLS